MVVICKKCKKEIPDNSAFCNICGERQGEPTRRNKMRRANGEGSAYKRGKTWTAVARGYINHELVCVTKGGFPNETQARRYAALVDLEAEYRKKKAPKSQAKGERKDILFKDLYEEWYAQAEKKERSNSRLEKYRFAYARFASLHECKWADLLPMDFQDAIDDAKGKDGKPSGYYAKKDMRTIANQMGIHAVKNSVSPYNNAQYIDLPELEEEEQKCYAAEEVSKMYMDYLAGNKFAGYMTIMCFTAMRPGEALGVLADNIDYVNGYIKNSGIKTKKSKRSEIVFDELIGDVIAYVCGTERMIEGYSEDAFRTEWKLTCARLGIQELLPKHARHTGLTLFGENGTSPLLLQEIARHTRFETTKKYIHLNERKQKQAEIKRATLKILST